MNLAGWLVALILAVLYIGFWPTLIAVVLGCITVLVIIGTVFLSMMGYFHIKQRNDKERK